MQLPLEVVSAQAQFLHQPPPLLSTIHRPVLLREPPSDPHRLLNQFLPCSPLQAAEYGTLAAAV